jgi:hypothetical protein
MGIVAGRPEAAKRSRSWPLSRAAALTAMLGALSSADACGSTSGIGDVRGGGGGAAAACEPGATRVCIGSGRCDGGQFCDSTGHWGGCDCGGAGNGGASSSDAGTQTGSGGTPVGAGGAAGGTGLGGAATTGPIVGRACQVDADCGAPGTFCLSSASNALVGGGPAHGLCTSDCSADPTVCAAVDATSICVGLTSAAGTAYCLETCTVGPVVTKKCHARPDFACDDSGSGGGNGVGFCRPVCRGNVDCAGRQCDVGIGLCKDGIPGTLPIGSACDVTATPDPCRGACVPLGQGGAAGTCTGFCSIGTIGCGKDPASTAPLGAACLFDGTIAGIADVGDVGLCGALCDCDSECASPGRVCAPLEAPDQAAYGRAGYCGGVTDAQGQPRAHLATCPLKR